MASRSASVFAAIFPAPTTSHTTPTPQATPDTAFAAPGQAFGGPSPTAAWKRSLQTRQRADVSSDGPASAVLSAAQRQVKDNLAWSTATQFLRLGENLSSKSAARHVEKRRSNEVENALTWLLVDKHSEVDNEDIHTLRVPSQELLVWYLEEVSEHFNVVYKPSVHTAFAIDGRALFETAWEWLQQVSSQLSSAIQLYMLPVENHILAILQKSELSCSSGSNSRANALLEVRQRFLDEVRAMFARALDRNHLQIALTLIMLDIGRAVCSLPGVQRRTDAQHSLQSLTALLKDLVCVGISAEDCRRSLAPVTDRLLDELIRSPYCRVDWYGRQSIAPKLRAFVESVLSPFICKVSAALAAEESNKRRTNHASSANLAAEEVRQWCDMAVSRLGQSRVQDLFDFIVRWDESAGAIKDIRDYITMPGARLHLVSSFHQQLQRRLLHAGATTVQILDTYIYTIRAFSELDPKGVLLDRVARPVRRYLKDRDDTTRIIIASFLADIESEGFDADDQYDISMEVARQTFRSPTETWQEADADLDWNNMDWTPDPYDAGPDHRRSRTDDVLSSLLNLYDREDFISELKNILSDHLLKAQEVELEKEIRLLELFKAHLGDDKLQAAEVMLHDVEESRHINASIYIDPSYRQTCHFEEGHTDGKHMDDVADGSPIDFFAQIISSHFWPPLRDDSFKVPPTVERQQGGYESSFRALKDMRRLKWFHALGRANVELELQDRTVELECTTCQASLIYAFQDSSSDDGKTGGNLQQLSIQDLVDRLDMDESLVRQSVAFWITQMVITEVQPASDTFTVLETLPSAAGDGIRSAEAAAAAAESAMVAAGSASIKSPEDVLMENMDMYRQFVLGMLTNQGKMDTQRMHMMLRMVVPGGFGFGQDELRILLQRMSVEGLVSVEGDNWSVVR